MASYTCEDDSICTRCQSAICLHCNYRLCLFHINEHNKIIVSSITNLSNEVKTTFQQIKEESENRKIIFNNILTSFNQWRIEQIEKIQQTYDNHLKLIESQREVLNSAEVKLFEQLEQNALQPLEHIQRQQNASIEMINHIQQTIKKVREDSAYLNGKLATSPSSIDIEYSPLNIPSISMPIESLKSGKNNNKSKTKKKKSSTKVVKQPYGHPLKRLVKMFSDISHIEKAKNDIAVYVKDQRRCFKLPNFICSYLTAWYRKSRTDEKVFVLNEHITTIKKHLTYRKRDFDILLGIQLFFYNEDVKEDKNEMMTFLLQFFLNHQCVDQCQILKWYNYHGKLRYEGFNEAKQLASQFIESFSASQTVNNVQTNPTSVHRSHNTEIKQEPIAMI